MSSRYELFFVSTEPVLPDRAAFERHFAQRERYAIDKGHAHYENQDTGVAFSFDIALNPPPPSGRPRAWARFVLDFVRPSFFAEEATKELDLFTSRFGRDVLDAGDAEHTSFSAPAFLRSWETGNRAALGPYRPATHGRMVMPRGRLLAVWDWNFRRHALQSQEGGDVFVPRVWFIRMGNEIATSVIWPDAMAIRVPQVDQVIFSRDALAPRGKLGRRPDVAVTPWRTIAASITGSAFYDSPLVSWRIVSSPVLIGLAQQVAALPGAGEMPEIVASQDVLDLEGFADAPGSRP
jgi:hypothetical protein